MSRRMALTTIPVQVFSFLVGYITQNIHYTLWTGLGGTVLAFLVVVPPWPFFNQHAVTWLPVRGGTGGVNIVVDGQSIAS